MNYETFKDVFPGMIGSRLPAGRSLTCQSVTKLNGAVMDALLLAEDISCVSPTIYLNDLYRMYEAGQSLEELTDMAVNVFSEEYADIEHRMTSVFDFDQVSEHICCRLINRGWNKDLLKNCPSLDFLDLSIVYYLMMVRDGEAYRMNITYDLLDEWKKTPDDLIELSAHNTQRLNPRMILNLPDLKDVTHELADFYAEKPFVCVVTGRHSMNGAIHMLDMRLMREMADLAQDDLLILPSSIHEIIVASGGSIMRKEADELIKSVNRSHLDRKEYLSDHAYLYQREQKRIVM